jgi:hypothetical protein
LLDELIKLKDEYNKHLEEKSTIQAQYVTKTENNEVDLAINKCNTHKYIKQMEKLIFRNTCLRGVARTPHRPVYSPSTHAHAHNMHCPCPLAHARPDHHPALFFPNSGEPSSPQLQQA